jgi:hypothetical protein
VRRFQLPEKMNTDPEPDPGPTETGRQTRNSLGERETWIGGRPRRVGETGSGANGHWTRSLQAKTCGFFEGSGCDQQQQLPGY